MAKKKEITIEEKLRNETIMFLLENLRKTNILDEKPIKTLGKPIFWMKNQSKPKENQYFQ